MHLGDLFVYRKDGVLLHKVDNKHRLAGQVAGHKNEKGYWRVSFGGSVLRRSRVVWAMFNGELPRGQIDHINGIRDDDRIENLRDVSAAWNQQNRRLPQNNSFTGFLGVTKNKNRFVARLRIDGKQVVVGSFVSPEEARAAYVSAKTTYHPGYVIEGVIHA